jgi:hypothetical protein
MDALTFYRQIVEATLKEFVNIQYAYGNIQNEIVFDREENRYLVMSFGWHNAKRIHGCLIHIDIANGKAWIQRDGTEHGIAKDLERAGIPKQDIVLGFHPADVRKHTEYAVA